MYIQVTTRCNMRCKHCKFACSPTRGKDMPLDLFREAADIAIFDYENSVGIGGGEPTLHPDLIFMLGYVTLIGGTEFIPFMITNGTVEPTLWRVLTRAREAGHLTLYVSADPWHDISKIPQHVSDYADEHKLWWGNTGRRVIERAGRARRRILELQQEAHDWGYDQVDVMPEQECGPRVDPDGNVWADVPKKFGGGKIGRLSSDTYGRALEVIFAAEEAGVQSNPHPSPEP